eukprot:TRINITY_DN507_c0_g1_i1.p1 TRINITY_DN507_c0_g1~~TRINITY_DN507_c0_g1_i1.p1  ORF type:complete len:257 (+),score=35.13 TRINITY_DN507_c0_g1_i1:68-838(+)
MGMCCTKDQVAPNESGSSNGNLNAKTEKPPREVKQLAGPAKEAQSPPKVKKFVHESVIPLHVEKKTGHTCVCVSANNSDTFALSERIAGLNLRDGLTIQELVDSVDEGVPVRLCKSKNLDVNDIRFTCDNPFGGLFGMGLCVSVGKEGGRAATTQGAVQSWLVNNGWTASDSVTVLNNPSREKLDSSLSALMSTPGIDAFWFSFTGPSDDQGNLLLSDGALPLSSLLPMLSRIPKTSTVTAVIDMQGNLPQVKETI